MAVKKIDKFLNSSNTCFVIISLSFFLRLIISSLLELGNDEVYYTLYSENPDLSHFDHPPLVGFLINGTTFNSFFHAELFVRLGAVISFTISSFYFFKAVRLFSNVKVANISLLLYSSSIYAFVISGIFIMPDAPLMMFWMLSFYAIIKLVYSDFGSLKWFLLFGLFSGLAIYSKYHAVFLWLGLCLFILLYHRKVFLSFKFYLSLIFPLIFGGLILYWNYLNDFVSVGFHSERVSMFSDGVNSSFFLKEFFGEIAYTNPFNWLLIFFSLFSFFKLRKKIPSKISALILCLSLPLIFLVLYFSLFRETLPHWVGPAYSILLIFPSVALVNFHKRRLLWFLYPSILLIVFVLPIGVGVINHGWFISDQNNNVPIELKGKDDFTLDMYGWNQAGEKYELILDSLIYHGIIEQSIPLVSNKWFPAAHIDYYIAKPSGQILYCIGSPNNIHEFIWINQKRGDLEKESEVLYLYNSRNNIKNVKSIWGSIYYKQDLLAKFPIYRNKQVVEWFFLYKLSR